MWVRIILCVYVKVTLRVINLLCSLCQTKRHETRRGLVTHSTQSNSALTRGAGKRKCHELGRTKKERMKKEKVHRKRGGTVDESVTEIGTN